ncbi:MAG: outer membrane beta-barrel protein [Bacteroidota bacterium]
MRTFSLFTLLFLATALPAQDYILNGWGVEVLPHFGSRRLVAATQIDVEEIRAIEAQERGSFGYAVGVFYRNRGEKLGTRFGLRYQSTGFEGNRREFPDLNPPRSTEIEYRTQVLEVPFWLDFYQNFGEKSSFIFSFGLSAGAHFGQEFEVTTFRAGEAPTTALADDNYRSFNIGFMSGLGFERRLGSKLVLGVQPQFQYFILGNTVNETNDLNRNLFNMAVRLTLMRIN